MDILPKRTRFRAYQLGCPGSSFSYFDGTNLTLIEARLTDISERSLVQELYNCGKGNKINILHITSWDIDHCSPNALRKILTHLTPDQIDIPGYSPITDTGRESLSLIHSYIASQRIAQHSIELLNCAPENNRLLLPAIQFEFQNVLFHPYYYYDECNDNSTVMLFRTGSFTLLSLGDVEMPEIAETLMQNKILNSEVDVMILAHHGADNGFTTDRFIKVINPSVAVSSSNYDSQFEHPKPEIRKILFDNKIPIYTTKTGDLIIQSIGDHTTQFEVLNLIGNSTEVSSKKNFTTKRAQSSYSPLIRQILGYK